MTSAPTTSETSRPLRVALVGYGLAGSVFHAPLIAGTDGLVLDTVVTGRPERREQARAEFPGVRLAARADEVWSRAGELDLAVIASPNRTHVPLATAALSAGLNVVVDKPVAGSSAEAAELAALAERQGVLLSAFHNRRWDGDFLTVRRLVTDRVLGDVWRFESRYERWRPQPKGGWRESGDPEDIGGLLYDLGSHVVDQALVLFGPAAVVYAESEVRRAGTGADDDTFIALTHAGGVRSHLYVSATAAQLGPRFRVLGSRAGYVSYAMDPQEEALRAGGRPTGDPAAWGTAPASRWGRLSRGHSAVTGDGEPCPTLPGAYPAYYEQLAAALRWGAPNPVPVREAVATLRVLEAARTSAREGRAVDLGGTGSAAAR